MQTALLLSRAFTTKEEQKRFLLALLTATSIPAKCRCTRPDLSMKLLPSETEPTHLGQHGLLKNKAHKERKCALILNAVSSLETKM